MWLERSVLLAQQLAILGVFVHMSDILVCLAHPVFSIFRQSWRVVEYFFWGFELPFFSYWVRKKVTLSFAGKCFVDCRFDFSRFDVQIAKKEEKN